MTFSVVVGDTVWQTPGWPVAVLAVNVLVAFGTAVSLSVHAAGGGLGHRGLAWGVLLVTLLTQCGWGIPLLVAVTAPKSALFAFFTPVAIEVLAGGLANLSLGVALTAWVQAPKGDARTPWAGLTLGGICAGIACLSPLHAALLPWASPLPELTLEAPKRVHVGSSFAAPVRVDGRGYVAPAVLIAPRGPGPFAVELRATRLAVSGTRLVTLEAGSDGESPYFPLRPGARWEYARTVHSSAQFLYFFNGDNTVEGEGLSLRVEADAPGPLRTVSVIRRAADGTETKHRVYHWNSEVLALLDDGTSVPFLTIGDSDEAGLRSCEVGALSGWSCVCGRPTPPPPDEAPDWQNPWLIPGPARCVRHEEPGAMRTGIGLFLLIATAGMVIDMGDSSHVIQLVYSEAP